MAAVADTGPPPDFYGPFLEAEQIAFQPDGSNPDSPELLLGDFTLQVVGADAIRPNNHKRFVLNALLAEPDGAVHNRDLLDADFHPDCASEPTRMAYLSKTITDLAEDLTVGGAPKVEKIREGRQLIISLASDLKIVRVQEDSLDFVPKPRERTERSAPPPPQRSLSVGEAEAREKLEMADRIKSYIAVGGAYPRRAMAFGTIVERKRAVRQAFADAHGDPDAEARLAELSRDLADEENRQLDLSHQNVSGYTSRFFQGAKPRRR